MVGTSPLSKEIADFTVNGSDMETGRLLFPTYSCAVLIVKRSRPDAAADMASVRIYGSIALHNCQNVYGIQKSHNNMLFYIQL